MIWFRALGITLWAWRETCTYLSTVEEDKKKSLNTLFETLDEWIKPKADLIGAFTTASSKSGKKTIIVHLRSWKTG